MPIPERLEKYKRYFDEVAYEHDAEVMRSNGWRATEVRYMPVPRNLFGLLLGQRRRRLVNVLYVRPTWGSGGA